MKLPRRVQKDKIHPGGNPTFRRYLLKRRRHVLRSQAEREEWEENKMFGVNWGDKASVAMCYFSWRTLKRGK